MIHVMRMGRCLTIIALLFLSWAMGVAARVVCVTMDRVPASVGLTRVREAVSPRGDAAMALVMARTGNDGQQRMIGEGYLTVNAERPCGLPRPLSLFIREEAAWLSLLKDACPTVGQLGDALRARGLRTGAIGSKEVFALLMDGEGRVDRHDPVRLQPTPEDLARTHALLAAVDIAVVNVSPGEAMLGWLRTLLDGLEADTRVLICSVDPPLVPGISCPAGWALVPRAPGQATALYSPSTRRSGLITNSDIAPTLLAWLGHPGPSPVGASVQMRGHLTADALLEMESALYRRTAWRSTVFLRYINLLVPALLLLVACGFLRGGRWAEMGKRTGRWLAVAIPATWLAYTCTGIFPTTLPALAGEFALGLLLAWGIARAFRRRAVLALWAAAGLLTVACALFLPHWPLFNQASYLILRSPRFYGLGNLSGGIMVAGALALALLLLARSGRPARILPPVILWGTAGWLFWTHGGANFGMGIAAAAQAVAFHLTRFARGQRIKWAFAFSGATCLLLGGLIWFDLATGASSHIARLLAAVLAEGWTPLLDSVARKGLAAWRLLTNSTYTNLLLLALAALVIHLGRCRSWWQPSGRARRLLTVGFTTLVASLLVNDSGVEPASLLALFLVTGFLGLEEEEAEEEAAVAPLPATEQAT